MQTVEIVHLSHSIKKIIFLPVQFKQRQSVVITTLLHCNMLSEWPLFEWIKGQYHHCHYGLSLPTLWNNSSLPNQNSTVGFFYLFFFHSSYMYLDVQYLLLLILVKKNRAWSQRGQCHVGRM